MSIDVNQYKKEILIYLKKTTLKFQYLSNMKVKTELPSRKPETTLLCTLWEKS